MRLPSSGPTVTLCRSGATPDAVQFRKQTEAWKEYVFPVLVKKKS